MNELTEQGRDYFRIKQAIEFLNSHPSANLEQCAESMHLSPQHFQKLFKRWAGVSPKQYSRFLKKEYAIQCLRESQSLSEAALESHLSGTARLHDLFISFYAMTPGEFQQQGQGLTIHYGFHDSPFGPCLIASTERGICKLAFYDNEQQKHVLLNELQASWGRARLELAPQKTAPCIEEIFLPNHQAHTPSLRVLLKGSRFQIQVWEALLRIPEGQLSSYQALAKSMGKATATRAVSGAIAKNDIALLIPCHRVIRQNGDFNQYRWGASRKQAIIAWEASQN